MKNENGAGSFYKLKGKHHRPWVAYVTTGWKLKDGRAVQIRKMIGSFATKEEAREILMAYRKNPVLPDAVSCTLEDVYNKWWEGYQEKVVSPNNIIAGWRYLKKLHNARFSIIRPAHIEDAINEYNYNAQKRAKTVLNHVYRFALKNELIDKNYASMSELSATKTVKRIRSPFTAEEIETIWSHEGEMIADMILIQIYSGWRPRELFNYRIDKINDCMVGGSKTEAGRERIVPINPDIRHIVYKYEDGFKYGYQWYWENFKKFTESLGMDHIPHECRHTFTTIAKQSGVDEYILKRIVGHSINDLTEAVYTHRSIDDLKREMAKINTSSYRQATVMLRIKN